ncbi:mitochondrial 54S ribosomal protein YmL31 [Biscogniauxia sp. FL1348]|nr:mitochondrial 54S ribosomal protein YmL31 [Biscogniauxia sp. FL1348]
MFGAFRPTNALSGGLLWKIPWRLSKFQKARQRHRLRAVDSVVATIDRALAKKGETLKALEVWKETMPTEAEMLPKDKYTMFDQKQKRYRKGIHSMSSFNPVLITLEERKLPKWTRVSQRVNPPGY